MNKLRLVKRFLLSALTVVYDIASLFWCYILFNTLWYDLTFIYANENGVRVVRGVEVLRLLLSSGKLLMCGFYILFVLFNVTAMILLTVSTCKKHTSQKLRVVLCLFLLLTFVVFIRIPPVRWLVPLSAVLRPLLLSMNTRMLGATVLAVSYRILSLTTIAVNVCIAIKRKGSRRPKRKAAHKHFL